MYDELNTKLTDLVFKVQKDFEDFKQTIMR